MQRLQCHNVILLFYWRYWKKVIQNSVQNQAISKYQQWVKIQKHKQETNDVRTWKTTHSSHSFLIRLIKPSLSEWTTVS